MPENTPKLAVKSDIGLHVYSAACSWHGPIENVGKTKTEPSIPCCPYCGMVLFQQEEEVWWAGALRHQENGHTNYEKFLRWSQEQPKCWPTLKEAAEAYKKETKNDVILGQ